MNQKTIEKLLAFNKNLYCDQAIDWDKSRQQIWEKPLVDFANQIAPSATVLDIGCGNARLYQLLQDKTIQYTGLDASKNLIDLCRKKYPAIDFQVADALDIVYHDQFDYALSIAVLHHIPSQNLQIKFLKNIFHCLKPHGQIFLTVWNRHQAKYQKYFDKTNDIYSKLSATEITDMATNDLLVPWRKTNSVRYIYAYTKEELAAQAKLAGFQNIEFSYADKYNTNCNQENGLYIILTAQK